MAKKKARAARPKSTILLTFDEAAAQLTVSRRTLYKIIMSKKISVVRISNRRVAIRPADLDAFVLRQRIPAKA